MKKLLFLISISASLFLVACQSSDSSAPLTLSAKSISAAYDELYKTVNISSNTSWTVTSDQSWCTPYTTSGTGDKTLVLGLIGNTTTSARNATLTFVADKTNSTASVTQAAGSGSEYHYKIPVIFHVLYSSATDTLQYVRNGRLATVIANVNKLYSANNMNMEFVMATYDPNGNELTEPGVDREQLTNATLDCEKFMDGKLSNNTTFVNMLWDLKRYVNIYLYAFKEDDSGYTTMGITHMPYMPTGYALDGLNTSNYYAIHSFDYPHCASINNQYIYEESDSKSYNPMDVNVTIAHELGHYLGLLHAFTETGEDPCSGTDYCDDTPNYDRTTYETWLANLIDTANKNKTNLTMKDVVVRTACDGSTFSAHNIMDYEYCYADQFTANQRTRVRYVLNHCNFVPGPKYNTATTSSSSARGSETRPPIIYKSVNLNNRTAAKLKGLK